MNYVSANVKTGKEPLVKNTREGGVAVILEYVRDELYFFEYGEKIRFFRPYIGRIQDVLLIGISSVSFPDIEKDLLSDNPTYGIAMQIDYPEKGNVTLVYKKYPPCEFNKIDVKKFILIEILVVERDESKCDAFWGSLDKDIFPRSESFNKDFKRITDVLEKDHLTMGLSAHHMTNKLTIFGVKYL